MADIGAMRHRVTLQRENSTPDGAGGQILAWQDIATVFARVTPKSGGENASRGAVEPMATFDVLIRRHSEASTASRLIWNGAELNIRSILNFDERGEFLTLACEAGVTT